MNVSLIFGGVDGASVFPLEIPPADFSPAMLVQSVMRGKDPFGTFQNVGVNAAGAMLNSDFGTEVARGLYTGYEIVRKFGRNEDIDTGTTPEDVFNGGGTYTGLNGTSNENIAIVSASANDTGTAVTSGTTTGGSATTLTDSSATFITDSVAVGDTVLLDSVGYHGFVASIDSETQLTVHNWLNGDTSNYTLASGVTYRIARATGTGAAVVRLSRIVDEDFNAQIPQYAIMNGLITVTVSVDAIRCSTARVITAGSNGVNVGDITANMATTTANVYFEMPTIGRTLVAASTIPRGKNAIMKKTQVAITRASGTAGSATVYLYVRERGSGAFTALKVYELQTGGGITRLDIWRS